MSRTTVDSDIPVSSATRAGETAPMECEDASRMARIRSSACIGTRLTCIFRSRGQPPDVVGSYAAPRPRSGMLSVGQASTSTRRARINPAIIR